MADETPKRNREDFVTAQHRVLRETIAKSETDEPPMRMVQFGRMMPTIRGTNSEHVVKPDEVVP